MTRSKTSCKRWRKASRICPTPASASSRRRPAYTTIPYSSVCLEDLSELVVALVDRKKLNVYKLLSTISSSSTSGIFLFDTRARLCLAKTSHPIGEGDFYLCIDNIVLFKECEAFFASASGRTAPDSDYESLVELCNENYIYLLRFDETLCLAVLFDRYKYDNFNLLKINLRTMRDFLRKCL